MKGNRCPVWATVAFVSLVTNVAQGQPRAPKLELNLNPQTLYVPQQCPTTDTVTFQIRNNTAPGGAAIVVDWSSTYLLHTPKCVADYAPKSGAELAIPAQGVRNITVTLTFIEQCEGETTITFNGVIQGEPGDTDAKTLTVKCNESDPDIPTVSEWGLIVMTLIGLTAGTVALGRRRRRAAA